MKRRGPKILSFLRKAEVEVVESMRDESEEKDREKDEIQKRLRALEVKVRVIERDVK